VALGGVVEEDGVRAGVGGELSAPELLASLTDLDFALEDLVCLFSVFLPSEGTGAETA